MTETIITVQGRHCTRVPAELATLQLSANHDGSQRESVFAAATATAGWLRGNITALHDPNAGPIVSWSSDAVRVWGDRPWNNDGKQLAMVFHAIIHFSAVFSDFDALSHFVESAAAADGVTIGNLEWTLTKARQTELDSEARAGAVADALSKASTYANAIGLSRVTAIAIADTGMLEGQTGSAGGDYELVSASRGFMKMDASGATPLSLSPDDIDVSATVDARFIASAR